MKGKKVVSVIWASWVNLHYGTNGVQVCAFLLQKRSGIF
jgi:hypothetical protein